MIDLFQTGHQSQQIINHYQQPTPDSNDIHHTKNANQTSQMSYISKMDGGQYNQAHEQRVYRLWKIKQTLLNIKVRKISIIFINKLKQNANIISTTPLIQKHRNYLPQLSKVFQVIYHLIIILHYMSILCLLLLTSWSATLIKFDQNQAKSITVATLKFICLFAFITQNVSNFASHFFKVGTGMPLTLKNLKDELLHYNYLNNTIKIVFLIFFIIFPTNQALSSVYFVFLVISLFIGVTQLSQLEAVYIHTQKRQTIWRVSRIFGLNVLIIHIMATVVMAMTHIDQENNWFHKYDLVEAAWTNQYIASFYWSTIIVTTIGFGDISPNTPHQQLIISFLALVACILLTFNITIFSQTFAKLKSNYDSVELQTVQFRRMIRRDYKNNVNIDPSLKKRIYQHIQSLTDDKRELQFVQKNQFLSNLPDKLKRDYYRNTNKPLFSSIVFLNLLNNQTLSILSQKFNIIFMQKNQFIMPNDMQIKILEQGYLGLTYYKGGSSVNDTIFDQIKVGKRQSVCLLTSDFLTFKKQSNYRLKSLQYSIIWSIKTQDFINILKNNVMDFQFYYSVLHKHNYDDNEWATIQCSRCYTSHYRLKHSTFKCPLLSYIPIRRVAILRSLFPPEVYQARINFIRFKDKAPRTSVLKYWKNFLKHNFQFQHKRNVNGHLELLTATKQKKQVNYGSIVSPVRKNSKKFYNHYYMDKIREQIIEQQRYLNIQVDIPFNFQYYMPSFNPDRLVFTYVYKCQDVAASSVIITLKNVVHMKGQKFNRQKLGK